MTDTAGRNRVPQGVTTGGQFATEPKAETSITLDPGIAQDRDSLLALRDTAVLRAEALAALPGGGNPGLRHRAQLCAVAATVRAAYPNATAFDIEESDQPGSFAGYVCAVRDADGNDLTGSYYVDFGEDVYAEDITYDMLYDIQETYAEDNLPGVTFEGYYESGYMRTVDIDTAIAAGQTAEQDTQAKTADARRAEGILMQYRAHHDQADAPLAQTARAALADMLAFAKAENIDVKDLLEQHDR